MDGGAWWAAVHGVAKSRTRLSNFTFTFHFHALEKEMATHSSVLAWRIQGQGSLVGCRLWGCTESDTTEVTQQQRQQQQGFPSGTSAKELPANVGDIRDVGSIPGLGSSAGGGNGNPPQYSCLENPLDGGAGYGPQGRTESDATEAT